MTKEHKEEIERLITLKSANHGDKDSCERMINVYINPGYKFCKTCDPAVRSAFNLLRTWWNGKDKNTYTFIAPIQKTKR